MDIQIFSDLFTIGLTPIPVKWDVQTKLATLHPEHGKDKISITNVSGWMKDMDGCNGIALKLFPPFGMVDIDQKNSARKNIFNEWLQIIEANSEDILNKVCIETTRNGGHHIYIKYPLLTHKIALARSERKEVISIYTGGLLSYCNPTPGYELIRNSFTDIEELTKDEYDIIVAAGAYFNDDSDFVPGSSTVQLIDYPTEYESVAMQFDSECNDELFEKLLNSIDLYEVRDNRFKNKKYLPYLRKGSSATYSAKAYYHSKRLLIFSGSMPDFPSWHDAKGDNDTRWALSPTKILYYKNKRDWQKALTELHELAKVHNLIIKDQKPITKQPLSDRLKFPYDIFPQKIQDFISANTIQHEYLAGAILGAISAAIGNTTYLQPMQGYKVKAILYMAIVAPPGAAKTPAIKKAFAALEEFDHDSYLVYKETNDEYEKALSLFRKDKSNNDEPKKPSYPQTLIKDSTIEMVSSILEANEFGCCILADELAGFLNRFNQYKVGDEEQKWLELWSGNSILNQRVTTGIKKIMDPFCSIIGGIQPGVLESMSADTKKANGFYHRFLFIYPEPQKKQGWNQIFIPMATLDAFRYMFVQLINFRGCDRVIYDLSKEANELYREWFDYKNLKYDKSFSDDVKGIIAKYQDYCLRFALIIQVIEDGDYRLGLVKSNSMEKAIRLTEYFFGNMHKASKILTPETPLDKLNEVHQKIYDQLPASFSSNTFIQVCVTFGLKESAAKMFLTRQLGKIINKADRNTYEKIF